MPDCVSRTGRPVASSSSRLLARFARRRFHGIAPRSPKRSPMTSSAVEPAATRSGMAEAGCWPSASMASTASGRGCRASADSIPTRNAAPFPRRSGWRTSSAPTSAASASRARGDVLSRPVVDEREPADVAQHLCHERALGHLAVRGHDRPDVARPKHGQLLLSCGAEARAAKSPVCTKSARAARALP